MYEVICHEHLTDILRQQLNIQLSCSPISFQVRRLQLHLTILSFSFQALKDIYRKSSWKIQLWMGLIIFV